MSDPLANDPERSAVGASTSTSINPVGDVSGMQFERLISFSDAVMAIAITLLAFGLRLPTLDQGTDIGRSVLALAPQFQSYIVSFIVIGLYWVDHHQVFSYIRRMDATLIWLNLLFLLLISFLPFPTSLLGSYQGERAVVVLYAGTVAATGLMRTAIWWYAAHERRLVDRRLDQKVARDVMISGLVPPAVFLASIPVALWNPMLVVIGWILMLAVSFFSSLKQPPPRVTPGSPALD